MKKIIISLTTILAFQVNAQMKIGSNVKTLNSNTNLQVEAVSGDQVIITRDSGKVGIGTLSPAVKLDVIGTVKITDGTQGTGKVLVSDANGQASWQNASTLQAVNKDSTTASNGLTLSGKDVQLGGTLTKATTITTSASNTIALAGLQSGATSDSILVVNPSTGVVARKSAAAIAAGNTTHAILFNNTSKILTSTVNGVTDTTVINLTSLDSTSSSNGLTLSGKDVQLGGTLTKATTITTSASNTIALAGLQSGATSDSILVVNPSTGVIRRLSPSVLGSATEPWFSTTTNIGATLNTENIYQMGRVGVGTNNPFSQLDVRTNSNTSTQNAHFVNINSGTSAESQVGIGAGPGPWAKIVGYNDAIGFRNYSTGKENLTIRNGSGNIGIGTTTPPFKLTIIDTVAGGPSRFYMSNRSSAVNSHTEIIAQNDQGVNCLIGIMASTSNSSNPVTAASGTSSYVKSTDGPIYVMAGGFGVRLGVNGTSWISNSDRRIKKDILKIENGLNKLLTLNGYTYNYNADKDGEPRRVGVMAQEVQAVLPEAVTANNDGILGVKYSELTPLIIEAVKDLKIELDHKNKEIQEQKILIDQLFKELSEIKNKLR